MKYGGPPERLDFDPDHHVTQFDGMLWRLFRAGGRHPSLWNAMRYFGPIAGMRFDPHPPPLGLKQRGVMCCAPSPITAFVEVFQSRRTIDARLGDKTPNVTLSGWMPTRRLSLLDLVDSDFLYRNGQAHALAVGPKSHTQSWALAIDEQLAQSVDGLLSISPMWGRPMVTLFERAATVPSFPVAPAFSRLLGDPAMQSVLGRVRTRTGLGIRR